MNFLSTIDFLPASLSIITILLLIKFYFSFNYLACRPTICFVISVHYHYKYQQKKNFKAWLQEVISTIYKNIH